MEKMRPQKQLLQFVMLALLSLVAVVMTANDSFAALQCYQCHGNGTNDALPLDTPVGSAPAYRNISTGAVKGNHQTHLNGLNITAANQNMCARCHNNSGYTSSHRNGQITLTKSINASPQTTGYTGDMTDGGSFLFKNQTTVPTLGTCSSVNCHFERVTPAWGSAPASVTCATCHDAVPTSASHNKHTAQYGGASACVRCHPNNTTFQHATSAGNVGSKIHLTGMTGTYSGAANLYLPSQTPVYGSCSTNNCHSSGQGSTGTATGITYTSATWDGTVGCASCHKNMDTDATSPGDHVVHAQTRGIACATCHTGYTESAAAPLTHVDGNVNLSFSGKAAGTVYSQGASSALGNGFGTCSTSACHSSGQGTTGLSTGLTYGAVPTWGGTVTCASCHKNMDIDATATGDHVVHAQTKGFACATCHNGYTETTSAPLTHVDGNVDLSFSGAATGTVYSQGNNGPLGNGFGTCSTSACHSSGQGPAGTSAGLTYGTVTWGGTITCAGCHKNMDTDATATGDHVVHAQTRNIACATCHTGYTETTAAVPTHVDNNVNVGFGGIAAGTVYSQGAAGVLGNGYGSCATAYCHSSGQGSTGTATGITYATITWGSGVTSCASCHKNMDSDATATGDHVVHAQTRNIACATCHTGYTEAAAAAATHADGNINLSFSGKAAGTVYSQGVSSVPTNGFGTCSTSACHSSGQGTTGLSTGVTFGVATWGQAITCGSCHVDMYTNATGTGDHVKHAQTRAISCATCHNGYTETSAIPATHVDGNVNLSFTGTGAGTIYSQGTAGVLGNGFGTCTASTCHSSGQGSTGTSVGISFGTATWGATIGCGACHRNFDSDAAATGDHVVHAQTRAIACATCHASYTETTAVPVTHVDTKVDVNFTGKAVGTVYSQGTSSVLGNGFGTCSTSACHSSGQGTTGLSTGLTYGVATWGQSLTCASCHKNMDSDATATGDHVVHAQTRNIACAICHSGYTETTSVPTTHVDGNVNLTFTGKAVGTVYSQGTAGALGNGFGTCSTSACHSSGQGTTGLSTGLTYGSVPTWGGTVTCASCHKNMDTDATATGDHVVHAQTRNIACDTCHGGYTESTSTAATHVDGNVNLTFTGSATGTVYSQGTAGALGNGFGTCTTSACHSSGQGTTGLSTGLTYGTITWGGTVTCASCHKNMDSDATATGDHVKHAQGLRNFSCATCHNGYTETTATPASHLDGNVNLSISGTLINSGATPITAVYSQGAAGPLGNGFGSCTTNCHNGPGGVFTAPALAWGSTSTCASCHSFPPATAAHASATTAPANCNSCHSNMNAGGTVTTATFSQPAKHMDQIVDAGCSMCHGYPPVRTMAGRGTNASYSSARIQNYSGGGGVHDVAGHLSPSLKESQNLFFTPCLTCHPNSQHNQASATFGAFSTQFVQVVVDPQFKFDKNRPIVYTAKQSGTGKTSGTCNNVACHMQKSPIWSTETYTQRH